MHLIKNWFRNKSIEQKIKIVILTTCGTALAVTAVAIFSVQLATFRRSFTRDLEAIGEIIGENSTAALAFKDRKSAEAILSALKAKPHLTHASLHSLDGAQFAEYHLTDVLVPQSVASDGIHSLGRYLILNRPLFLATERVGTLRLISDYQAEYRRSLAVYVPILAGVLLVSVWLALLLSRRLQRLLSAPILQLAGTAQAVAENKDFAVRARKVSQDEVGKLTDAFNAMLSRIESDDAALRRANQELQREIAQHKKTEEALQTSERFMHSLLESLPQNIIRKDVEGRFVFANTVFCRSLGKSREEVVGKTDFDLFPQELAAKFRSDDAQVIASGKLFETVEEHRTTAGEKTFVQVIKTPLYDAENRPLGLQLIFWDVTERKRAEAELAYQRDLLQTLLDNMPDAIYFKDRESRFVHASRSMAALFHLASPEQLKGKSDADFFTAEHARPAFEDEQKIIQSGQPIIGKLERETHPDGRLTWALSTKLPWRDKDGNAIGTFGISKDFTAMKEAEQEVEKLNKELMVASRYAGMAEVATGVLHNVGNVLNSINVSTTLLREKLHRSEVKSVGKLAGLLQNHAADLGAFLTSDPKGRLVPSFIQQLAAHLAEEHSAFQQEIEQLARNVEHVKEIVAMQQNYARVSGVRETVSLTSLVNDALQMNVAGLTRHGVRVVRQYSEVPPITTDKHKVLQILVNLVHNAKYALHDAERPDKLLTVSLGMNGNDRVQVAIQDNGIGIPPENLTKVFSHGFTTRKNGHGFGLHSGANAAKEMGGSLLAHSEGRGKGATFVLELPLADSRKKS